LYVISRSFSQLHSTRELTETFSGCYRKNVSRGSSVVEQPIRNRQVASSTLALGSNISLQRN
jgi:hypothetical protein